VARTGPGGYRQVGNLIRAESGGMLMEGIEEEVIEAEVGHQKQAGFGVERYPVGVGGFLTTGVGSAAVVLKEGGGGKQ